MLLSHQATDSSITHESTLARAQCLHGSKKTALDLALELQSYQPGSVRGIEQVKLQIVNKEGKHAINTIVDLLKEHQSHPL